MKLPFSLRNNFIDFNTFVVAVIIFFSFTLRIIGIGVGLPNTPDPREALIAQEITNLINLKAFPEIYNWPGTAWFYLIGLIGKLLSFCSINMTESRVILLGRFINVCLSTTTVWLVYCLGSRCSNKRVGQIAAGFLAVTMLHATNESRFALVDIPATFCVTLFLLLIARDIHLTFRTCLWLGIVAGIGIAVKFPTVFVCFTLVMFIKNENIYRKYATIIGVAAITFTIVCPYWLIDLLSAEWNDFFQDFRYEVAHYHLGHFGLFATGETGWVNRFLYLWILLKWGMGLPLALLVCFSVLFLVAKSILSSRITTAKHLLMNHKMQLVLSIVCFVIPYLLIIGTFKVTFTRHLLILYPALTVLVAIFLFTLSKRIGAVIGSAVWLYSFAYTVAFASVMLTQPTTQQTSEWVAENIPIDGTISRAPEILFDWLIPELDRDMSDLDENTEWVIIIQPNREVFQKYEQFPEKYQLQDWYPLKDIEFDRSSEFYEEILGQGSSFNLHKTFSRSQQFSVINLSKTSAPFPMAALLHPTIHIYHRSKE